MLQRTAQFHIPLPLNIPPSVELPKNGGIKYEIQANFHYKAKGCGPRLPSMGKQAELMICDL
jgi:hypothetical protein